MIQDSHFGHPGTDRVAEPRRCCNVSSYCFHVRSRNLCRSGLQIGSGQGVPVAPASALTKDALQRDGLAPTYAIGGADKNSGSATYPTGAFALSGRLFGPSPNKCWKSSFALQRVAGRPSQRRTVSMRIIAILARLHAGCVRDTWLLINDVLP